MKKLLHIFISIFTFLIGIFSYYINFFLTPAEVNQVKHIIPFYELEKNSELYVGHKFTVQENIIVEKDSPNDVRLNYYLQGRREKCEILPGCQADYISCNFRERLNFVNFVEKNEVEMIKQIAEKNARNNAGDIYQTFGAKVEIEGYIKPIDWANDYFTIDVTNIKQISPIQVIREEEVKYTH